MLEKNKDAKYWQCVYAANVATFASLVCTIGRDTAASVFFVGVALAFFACAVPLLHR